MELYCETTCDLNGGVKRPQWGNELGKEPKEWSMEFGRRSERKGVWKKN
ncbi:hypothetical protein QNH28_02595 [Paenibacillus sp. G2S3]|nr:hypothetical protein [Paenibacillus sp. G2S3]WHY19934.1 hypothetical protein QNH28_02595 [Paenibacillus sp. G2S3]